MNYWLFKTEPDSFGIMDLARAPQQTTAWEGVRNYQARNFMRDEMKVGDLGFFYHSSCKQPGIIGIVEVVSEAYPDATAYDPQSQYFDPKSTREKPRWFLVDVQLKKIFPQLLPLSQLKEHKDLNEMVVLRKGNRLSITPISVKEWQTIINLQPSY